MTGGSTIPGEAEDLEGIGRRGGTLPSTNLLRTLADPAEGIAVMIMTMTHNLLATEGEEDVMINQNVRVNH